MRREKGKREWREKKGYIYIYMVIVVLMNSYAIFFKFFFGSHHFISTESLSSYRNEFISAFSSVGGNPAIFQSRQQRERERERRDEEKRLKRNLGNSSTEHGTEKRTKLSHGNTPPQKGKNTPPQQQQQQQPSMTIPPFSNGPSPLANFDITTLPLNIVIEICLAVLQSVPEQTIRQKINMVKYYGRKKMEKKEIRNERTYSRDIEN